ncbi:MAG: peptide-N-glycosidase F-related protein [Pseudomonadota bacterium]
MYWQMYRNEFFVVLGLLLMTTSVFALEENRQIVNAHDSMDMVWATEDYLATAQFPKGDARKTYRKIIMYYTLGCASEGCSDWDYTTQVWAIKNNTRYELGRVITPYAAYMRLGLEGFDSSWQQTYTFDVTDFVDILEGDIPIQVKYHGWNRPLGFSASVKFELIEGQPVRPVLDVQALYHGQHDYISSAEFEAAAMPEKSIKLSKEADSAKLRFTTTGHSFGNDVNCAEFCVRSYQLNVNHQEIARQVMWRDDCAKNYLFPQGGTWLYNRANWCPGDKVLPYEHELMSVLNTTDTHLIDLNIEEYEWSPTDPDNPSPPPYYITDAYLVSYGKVSAKNDAAVTEIIAPNNASEYGRANPICDNAIVKIKNNGSEPLKVALIEYGLEGGFSSFYPWRGHLAFGETETVTLPRIMWRGKSISNKFYVEITKPNLTNDEYDKDNILSTTFDFPRHYEQGLKFVLATNDQAQENTYSILDAKGDVLTLKDGLVNESVYTETFETPGCYTLKIKDRDEDGLSWWLNLRLGLESAGSAHLENSAGEKIHQFQGDFGAEISHTFTVGSKLTSSSARN